MRDDRYRGTSLPRPVRKLCRMVVRQADREADCAHPDRLLAQAVEALLIDSANPTLAQTKLLRLLKQHQAEGSAFLGSVPERSWVREIAGRL